MSTSRYFAWESFNLWFGGAYDMKVWVFKMVWWHLTMRPPFGIRRKEDLEFKASLGYIASLRSGLAIWKWEGGEEEGGRERRRAGVGKIWWLLSQYWPFFKKSWMSCAAKYKLHIRLPWQPVKNADFHFLWLSSTLGPTDSSLLLIFQWYYKVVGAKNTFRTPWWKHFLI